MKPESESEIPSVPAWFQNGFHRFLDRFLNRHFHAIAIERQSRCERQVPADQPLIVFGNHPSWWDPLIAHRLNRLLFPKRQFYAPIDADALERYKVFAKLGFYGVQANTKSGAANFLKTSKSILNAPNTSIWLTPEGRFTDVRDHSVSLMPGLSHLCSRMEQGWVVPHALEYVFWNERLPVCLVKMGEPIKIADHTGADKQDWDKILDTRLRSAQTELSELAIARSSEPFDNLIRGGAGAGRLYDAFRRMKSVATGRKFRAAHGDAFE
ncbi:MAG: acyltransferase [Pirellulaceae bacterium]|nr:acyltransferase [Pirellulaceae bacterium]